MYDTSHILSVTSLISVPLYISIWLAFIDFLEKSFPDYGIFFSLLYISSMALPFLIAYIILHHKPIFLLQKFIKKQIFSALEDVSFLSKARYSEIETLQKFIEKDIVMV